MKKPSGITVSIVLLIGFYQTLFLILVFSVLWEGERFTENSVLTWKKMFLLGRMFILMNWRHQEFILELERKLQEQM